MPDLVFQNNGALVMDAGGLGTHADCCCCNGCSGAIPDQLEVEFTDSCDDNSCADCDDADLLGTFTLDRVAGLGCLWEYEFSPGACGIDRVAVSLITTAGPGSDRLLLLQQTNNTYDRFIVEYSKNVGTAWPDCDAWSSLSMDGQDSLTGSCNCDGLTATITAL